VEHLENSYCIIFELFECTK